MVRWRHGKSSSTLCSRGVGLDHSLPSREAAIAIEPTIGLSGSSLSLSAPLLVPLCCCLASASLSTWVRGKIATSDRLCSGLVCAPKK